MGGYLIAKIEIESKEVFCQKSDSKMKRLGPYVSKQYGCWKI